MADETRPGIAAIEAAMRRLDAMTPTCDQCGTRGLPPARVGDCPSRVHIAAIRCTRETWAVFHDNHAANLPTATGTAVLPGLPIHLDEDMAPGAFVFVDTAGATVNTVRVWPEHHRLIRSPFGDWSIDEALVNDIWGAAEADRG